jgi:hypothetical protein
MSLSIQTISQKWTRFILGLTVCLSVSNLAAPDIASAQTPAAGPTPLQAPNYNNLPSYNAAQMADQSAKKDDSGKIASLIGAAMMLPPCMMKPPCIACCIMAAQALAQAGASGGAAGGARGAGGQMSYTAPDPNNPNGPGGTTDLGRNNPAGTNGGEQDLGRLNRQLTDAGVRVDPSTGTIIGPDGKSYSMGTDTSSAASLRKAGFSESDILKAMGVAKEANLKAQGLISGQAVDADGGAGSTNGANGMSEASGTRRGSFDFSLPGNGSNSAGKAEVSGLARQFGDDRIGVAGDDIFGMIKRRYEAQDKASKFLKQP